MRAALIFRLARARRCAIAGSVTRKDRATSLVDSPPSSRRVSATCASVDSAGWQQVKISRSRSSSTGPTSWGAPRSLLPGESIATSPSSFRPRDSRRRRSIARLRAVVAIQPPGFGGSPSAGHLRKATVNASCTASSATSMSPKTRIRTATDRPDSSRKIRPTSAPLSLGAASMACSLSGLGYVSERADLDRLRDGSGGLRGPGERRVEVLGLDDVEAAQVFLRLRKGAVGGQHLAVGHAHDRCGIGFVQGAAEEPSAGRLHLLLEDADPLHELPHLLLAHRVADLALDAVHGQQVLRHAVLLVTGGHFPPLTQLRTGLAQTDTYQEKLPEADDGGLDAVILCQPHARCPCPAIPRGAYVSSGGRPHCSNSQGSGKPTIPAIRSSSIRSTIRP